jgi:hypothetical protein
MQVTVTLPPCPIAAQKIDLSSAFTIPANPGAIIKIKASGTVTAKDDMGAVILQVTVSPPFPAWFYCVIGLPFFIFFLQADGSVGPH